MEQLEHRSKKQLRKTTKNNLAVVFFIAKAIIQVASVLQISSFFFVIPFYLQSVLVHSSNFVKKRVYSDM
jgi:hypothetical protein